LAFLSRTVENDIRILFSGDKEFTISWIVGDLVWTMDQSGPIPLDSQLICVLMKNLNMEWMDSSERCNIWRKEYFICDRGNGDKHVISVLIICNHSNAGYFDLLWMMQ